MTKMELSSRLRGQGWGQWPGAQSPQPRAAWPIAMTSLLIAGLASSGGGPIFAEDITVSTYYPSPRGVYQELRTTDNTYLATLAGRVGIGTTAPGARLEVQGIAATTYATLLRLVNANNDAAALYLQAANRNWAIAATNPASGFGDQKLVFYDDTAGFPGGARMTINAAGNVGIGTTNPASKLVVFSGLDVLEARGLIYLESRDPRILMFDTDAPISAARPAWQFGQSGANFVWRTTTDYATFSSDLMTMTATGRVGIGTTTPADKLEVSTTGTGGAGLTVTRDNDTTSIGGMLLRTGATQDWLLGERALSNSDLHLFSYGTGTDVLTILRANGNVGIGTSNPDYKLTVFGGAAPMRLVGLFAGYGQLYLDGDPTISSDNWFLGAVADANGGFIVRSPSSGVTAIYATQAGNVGIGTTAPNAAYRLDVTGDIRATGTVWGNSDARFKTDLQPLTGVLPKLEGLHAISYRPRAQPSAQSPELSRSLGVLGQELEQVFPELVSRTGPEAYRAVDYSRLTVVLLEAVKELHQETEALKEEVATLKQENAALQGRLAAMEEVRR